MLDADMVSGLHLELSFANGFDELPFKEIAEDLGAGGARVYLRQRPPEGPYASLDWLIPSAIVVFMVKPYIQEFMKETGKLHANGLHNGLSKLWDKVFGPKPEVKYNVIGSQGKVRPEVFSRGFSVKTIRNDGGIVTLLFPSVTSLEDCMSAVVRFIELMEKHYENNGDGDRLTNAMSLIPYLNRSSFQVLVCQNSETKKLELIDYMDSSRLGRVIAYPIE